MAIDLTVSADKIVVAIGTKNVSLLTGTKSISEFNVDSDKIVSLSAYKGGSTLSVLSDKTIILNGEKTISELSGLKTTSALFGSIDNK